MKTLKHLLLQATCLIIMIVGLGACGSSTDVVSKGLVGKRKYNKGVHRNFGFARHKSAVPEKKQQFNLKGNQLTKQRNEIAISTKDSVGQDIISRSSNIVKVQKAAQKKLEQLLDKRIPSSRPLIMARNTSSVSKVYGKRSQDTPPEDDRQTLGDIALGFLIVTALLAGAAYLALGPFAVYVAGWLFGGSMFTALVAFILGLRSRKSSKHGKMVALLAGLYILAPLVLLGLIVLFFWLASPW